MDSADAEGQDVGPVTASMDALKKDITRKASIIDLLRTPAGSSGANSVSADGQATRGDESLGDGSLLTAAWTSQASSGSEQYVIQQRQAQAAHENGMLAQARKKAEQENELRSSFFGVAISMAIFVLIMSNFGVLIYLAQTSGQAAPEVLVAWLVSVVAEVVAILHIIAKYLFPANNGN